NRQEVLTEMTTGVGAAFLGLTVGCARCHDHKFDPFSQADYYRLQAFFAATRQTDIDIATAEERDAVAKEVSALNAQLAPRRTQVPKIDPPIRTRLTAAKREKLEKEYRDALDTDPKKRTPQQKKLAGDAETLIKVTWDEILDALSPADREKRA